MSIKEIKEQAISIGMSEKAALALTNAVWAHNLVSSAVGASGNWKTKTTGIRTVGVQNKHKDKVTGHTWEVEHFYNFNTGSYLRSNKVKEKKINRYVSGN